MQGPDRNPPARQAVDKGGGAIQGIQGPNGPHRINGSPLALLGDQAVVGKYAFNLLRQKLFDLDVSLGNQGLVRFEVRGGVGEVVECDMAGLAGQANELVYNVA